MTVQAPTSDEDVPRFCRDLGVPGVVDVHTHFMPDRVLQKVWSWFDTARLPDGTPWSITYRTDDATRVAHLRRMGVLRFTALSYPHRPDMAEWLNGWAMGFADAVPECVRSATFFPEQGADRYVAEALEAGAGIFKAHLQVGGYDPRDALLRPVWRRLADAGVPVVVHCGSGPVPGRFTGPGPFGEVLEANPSLVALIAHMGGGEYEDFLRLALRYPRVHLDVTMTFTDFMARMRDYPRALLPTLAEHPDRIVFGSDFPNIPHRYFHQLQALVRLDLGDDWLRAVCHDNGKRLLEGS
jgi:uncharacterized protein